MSQLANELYTKHVEIFNKSKELKSLKKAYEDCEDEVKSYMIREQISNIKLENGKVLHIKEKKSLSSINKDYILETLKSFYKNAFAKSNGPDELAEQTTDTIIENREVKFSTVLKFLNK